MHYALCIERKILSKFWVIYISNFYRLRGGKPSRNWVSPREKTDSNFFINVGNRQPENNSQPENTGQPENGGVWSETMFLVNPTMDRDSVSWHWPSWGEDAAVTAWSETMSLALFVDIPVIR